MTEKRYLDLMPLAQLVPADNNPKLHADEQIGTSIGRFGFVDPIVLDERTGKMVAGHGRRDALLKLQKKGDKPPEGILVKEDGTWLVPVARGWASKSDREAEAFLLADNRLVELGGWDDVRLTELLTGLMKSGEDMLAGIGWSTAQLDELLKTGADPMAIGENPKDKLPGYVAGEIRQLVLYFAGEAYEHTLHRLQTVMGKNEISNHTAAFVYLLDFWEKNEHHPEA